ncbi:MAG TPA: helix-turn-helix domain-containing protein [Gammaproteobacteria bacterium]
MRESDGEALADVADAATVSVGDMLRSARTARSLTLEQVSMELRIEPQQLLALEEERFEAIGPPVFVKGYLRHYGTLLGLDAEELVRLYAARAGEREVELKPSRTIRLHDEHQITLWIIAVLVLAALAAVVVLWWLGDGSFTLDRASSPVLTGGVRFAPPRG